MELKTEAPTTPYKGNPEISYAIGLLTAFADLIDKSSPGGQQSHDEHMAVVTALKFTQADIEAPLLARIEALGGSIKAAMAELDSLKLENAELRQGRDSRLTVIHLPADDTEGGDL